MEIDFSDHALRQMARRGVTREDVAAILGSFYYQYTVDGDHLYSPRLRGRHVRVVVVPGTNPPTVKTVFIG